jgi:hypothetical protein
MSDLQWNSAPTSITICSSRTGVKEDFYLTGTLSHEDLDGEIDGYLYQSMLGYKIHLYND